MAEMGEMSMPVPRNSIPMLGAPVKHGYIDMGGLLTILTASSRGFVKLKLDGLSEFCFSGLNYSDFFPLPP